MMSTPSLEDWFDRVVTLVDLVEVLPRCDFTLGKEQCVRRAHVGGVHIDSHGCMGHCYTYASVEYWSWTPPSQTLRVK